MSLILEALRKLERDKDAPERGFVVMTHVPWAQGAKRSRLVAVSAFALALAMGALAIALWPRRGTKPAAPEPRPTAAAAAPAAPPTTAPAAAPSESPAKAPTPAPFDARALALESRSRLTAAPEPPAASATPLASIPPRPSAQPRSDLRLNAISQRDGKPVAILNDRLVHEGDVFEGIRVVRIGETEVEVEVKGERRVLRF